MWTSIISFVYILSNLNKNGEHKLLKFLAILANFEAPLDQ